MFKYRRTISLLVKVNISVALSQRANISLKNVRPAFVGCIHAAVIDLDENRYANERSSAVWFAAL